MCTVVIFIISFHTNYFTSFTQKESKENIKVEKKVQFNSVTARATVVYSGVYNTHKPCR